MSSFGHNRYNPLGKTTLHHCHPHDNVKAMAMPRPIPGGLKREEAVTGSLAVGTASEPQLGRRLRPAFRSCCQNVGHARLSKNNGRVSRLFDESGSDGGSVTGATCDPYLTILFEVEIALTDVSQVAVGRSVDMARTPLGGGRGRTQPSQISTASTRRVVPPTSGWIRCWVSARPGPRCGAFWPGDNEGIPQGAPREHLHNPLPIARQSSALSPARLSGATAIAHNRIV